MIDNNWIKTNNKILSITNVANRNIKNCHASFVDSFILLKTYLLFAQNANITAPIQEIIFATNQP